MSYFSGKDVNTILAQIENDLRHRYPDKDVSVAAIAGCDPRLLANIGRNEDCYWVKVENSVTGRVRTGWVSITSGWKPCLMLMRRKKSDSSSDLLSSEDRVIGHKYTDGYRPRVVR